MIDRVALKLDAKDKMSRAAVSPYIVSLIALIITYILMFIDQKFQNYVELMTTGGWWDIAELFFYLTPFLIYSLISWVISTVVNVGYRSYCLKVANRDASMAYSDLFSTVRYLFKALGLSFMTGLFILLWSLLLFIPGVIAAYSYSQAFYVLVEDPDKGIMQCIRESKEMMDGYKMELFILEWSFFFWQLLAVCTCGLGLIYVMPYQEVTFANFYNFVKPKEVVYEEADTIG